MLIRPAGRKSPIGMSEPDIPPTRDHDPKTPLFCDNSVRARSRIEIRTFVSQS